MTGKSIISTINRSSLCAGCGICSTIAQPGAIEMRYSEKGFLRPYQNSPLSDNEEALIKEVCPGIVLDQTPNENSTDHILWGPMIAVRVGHATDAALRFHASSGGVLSAILVYLLESDKVDQVIHIGASIDSPIRNAVRKSVNKDEVFRAAGSRYAPSAPLSDLSAQMEPGRRYAIVGKPCDIAAIRAFCNKNSKVREGLPYLISFICAGVPSEEGTKEILTQLGVTQEEVVQFQYRGDGWPGHAKAVTHDGIEHKMSYPQSWGGILSRHVQFRCKICPDGSGGFADLVCADAWHEDEEGIPILDEGEGRSLIITRTQMGEELVQEACSRGYVAANLIDPDEIEKMQPSQANRKKLVLSRLIALAVFGKMVPRYRNLNLLKAARSASIGANIKSFLGLSRRIVMRCL